MLYFIEALGYGILGYYVTKYFGIKHTVIPFTLIWICLTIIDPLLYQMGWFFAPSTLLISFLINGLCFGGALSGVGVYVKTN